MRQNPPEMRQIPTGMPMNLMKISGWYALRQ